MSQFAITHEDEMLSEIPDSAFKRHTKCNTIDKLNMQVNPEIIELK